MGKIKFDSVKLPYQLTEFARVVKGQNLTEATVKMKATLKQPQHRIPINGYFQKCSLTKPALNRSETRYVMQRVISQTKLGSKINLEKITDNLMETATDESLGPPSLTIRGAVFVIHNKKYEFRYHAPAKAIVLKKISGKQIGRPTQTQIDALLCKEGDLHFCLPSICRKEYVEKWVCEQ